VLCQKVAASTEKKRRFASRAKETPWDSRSFYALPTQPTAYHLLQPIRRRTEQNKKGIKCVTGGLEKKEKSRRERKKKEI